MKHSHQELRSLYLAVKIGMPILVGIAIMLYIVDIAGRPPDALASIKGHIVRRTVWYSKRRDPSTNEMSFYQVDNAVLDDQFTEQQFRAEMEKEGVHYLATAKFTDPPDETFEGHGVTINYQGGAVECWRKLNGLSVLRARLKNGGGSPFHD